MTSRKAVVHKGEVIAERPDGIEREVAIRKRVRTPGRIRYVCYKT